MVSTLRIAGVVVVVLAGLLLASATGFASIKALNTQTDEKLAEILSAPSVVERFQERQGDIEQSRQAAISPLVREAEALSLILNPPAPLAPPTQVASIPTRPTRQISTPVPPAAKFDLVGTSFSEAGQADCLAYIRMQDGKTSKWVQVGDEIGHLTIREIRSDSIVCWDGSSDVVLPVLQRTNTASLLEGGVSVTTAGTVGVRPSPNERITSGVRPAPSTAFRQRPVVVGAHPLAPRTDQAEASSAEDLAATLARYNQAEEGTEEQIAERQAFIEQMSELSAVRRETEKETSVQDRSEAIGRSAASPLRGRRPVHRVPR